MVFKSPTSGRGAVSAMIRKRNWLLFVSGATKKLIDGYRWTDSGASVKTSKLIAGIPTDPEVRAPVTP
jgi:hypothetical protein